MLNQLHYWCRMASLTCCWHFRRYCILYICIFIIIIIFVVIIIMTMMMFDRDKPATDSQSFVKTVSLAKHNSNKLLQQLQRQKQGNLKISLICNMYTCVFGCVCVWVSLIVVELKFFLAAINEQGCETITMIIIKLFLPIHQLSTERCCFHLTSFCLGILNLEHTRLYLYRCMSQDASWR